MRAACLLPVRAAGSMLLTVVAVVAVVAGLVQPADAARPDRSSTPTASGRPAVGPARTPADGPDDPSATVDLTRGLPGDFSGLGGTADPSSDGTGPADDTPRSSDGASDPALTEATGASAAPVGIDPQVQKRVDDGKDVAVIIRLRKQADPQTLQDAALEASVTATRRTVQNLHGTGLSPRRLADRAADAAEDARTAAVVTTLQQLARGDRGEVARLLAAQRSAGHAGDVRPYWVFNGFSATVDATALERLSAHPDVASVTMDETLRLPEPETESTPKLPTWGLESVHAPEVWGEYGDRGAGVVVGVMDSGADGRHPAIADSWRGVTGDPAKSWYVPTGEDYPTPGDGFGHGTHVTGTIVGGPPGDVIGVAPDAQWIAAKIFRDGGSTSDSIIHAGFQWMLAPGGDPTAAPDVVNNSWGAAATYRTEFWDDVNAWVAAGIVPMFANGNDGPAPGTVGSPGSYPQSIGVGATDYQDVVAGFSSRGGVTWDGVTMTKPQVSAPGHHIYSAWPLDYSATGYETISGTSMATPHASGVVALVRASAPGMSVAEVRSLIEDTARVEPHMGAVPDNDYGHGVIDSYAAVTKATRSGTVTGAVSGPTEPVTVSVVGVDWATTTSTDDGAYSIAVPAGARELRFSAAGFRSLRLPVDLTPGTVQVHDVTLEPAPVVSFTGTVSAPDGSGIDGARVSVEDADAEPAYADADGAFSLQLHAGEYDVRIVAPGYKPWRDSVGIDGSAFDVTLEPLGTAADPGWRQAQNNAARTGRYPGAIAAPSLRQDWQVDTGPGVVFSSPVIADGTAYVNSDDGRLLALDLDSGEQRWAFATSQALRGSAAVADGVVYLGGGVDGGINAVDAASGEPLWNVPTPGRLTVYTAPAVLGGTVYAVTGPTSDASDTVYALDPATGDVRWSRDVGAAVFAGPAVADGHLVVASGDDATMTALDPATGDVQWTLDRSDHDDYFVGGTSIADGVIYAVTTSENGLDGSMLAVDAETGDVLWENPYHGDGQGSTPAVSGDLVIAGAHGNGAITAYDRVTGDVAWRSSDSGPVSSSVLVTSDGYVIAGSQLDNRVFALDATSGTRVWGDTLTRNVTTTPGYDEGTLVAADTSGVVRAYASTGGVAGQVTGPEGPLAADVRIVGSDVSTTADADTGRYRLDHKPGTVDVEATMYGFSTESTTVDLVPGRTATADFALEPVGTGSLSGTVTDEAGDPVADATVTLAGTPLEPATTGADGGFGFAEVAAGTYTVRVSMPGYQTATAEASVVPGGSSTVEVSLLRYDVGVLGDYQGLMVGELEKLGYRAEPTTYADVTAHAGRYAVVVANGGQDDPGADALRAFVDATDRAGTSVVWLDQWGLSWGGIDQLKKHFNDPSEVVSDYNGEGRVSVIPTVEHPLTAGLSLGQLAPILVADHEWSAFNGYSGRSVADVYTEGTEVVGSGIAYAPRGMDSTHVLVANLAAAPWGKPAEEWLPAAETVLDNAISYARDAQYGTVAGTVADDAGTSVAARITDLESGEVFHAAADGSYALLLDPGEHTLRFAARGLVAAEHTVAVTAGQTTTLDVVLETAGLGAVTGTVTDEGGQPVAGADVSLEGADLATTTAADGSYGFTDVPAETYTVRVSAAGFLTATQEVTVAPGETATVDVGLHTAPRVGLVGDYRDHLQTLLESREMVVTDLGWSDVSRVGEFDVIVINDPSDPGAATFRSWMTAMDDAQVSGVFAEGYFSSDGGVRFLRKYEGNPADYVRVSDEGAVSYHVRQQHPIFDGLGDDPVVLKPDRFAGAITGYTGLPLADLVTEDAGDRGVGAAYLPRSAGSVHVLLGGLTAEIFQNPTEDWTAAGRQLFVNAVGWAAAPPLGTVTGTVTDADGTPVSGRVRLAGTGQQVSLDAAGRYTLYLPPGERDLEFTAFGYDAQTHPVTVTDGGTVTLDVTMAARADMGSVSGTVTLQGAPVADAAVRLLDRPRATTTAADGGYLLDVLEPGEYTLEVTAPGAIRYRTQVTVVPSGAQTFDVALVPTSTVGVIDDNGDELQQYLEFWGYRPEPVDWTDTATIADLDVVVANLASYSGHDPGQAGFDAFDRATVDGDVSVVWLDQFGRGSFRYLVDYLGDPASADSGRDDGPVRAANLAPDHPIMAGLPDTFDLVAEDEEYSWFDDFSGDVLATVSTGEVSAGGLVGVRARAPHAVDVLLGTLSVSTYGGPGYDGVAARSWTPDGERLLRNALAYAADPGPAGASVQGLLQTAAGEPLSGTVTVTETGRTVEVAADGRYLLGVPAGTWTLTGDAFGYQPGSVTVTVAAGDAAVRDIALDRDPLGAVAGTVTGPDGPVSGAGVDIVGTPLSATTAADGTYRVDEVPAGDWRLRVSADGFQTEHPGFAVSEGATTTVDVTLSAARSVAVVADYRSSIASLLGAEGFAVTSYSNSQLATLAGQVGDYDVVILNDGVYGSQEADFLQVVDAAEAAGVSVIFAGQWGGDAIGEISDLRGDPQDVEYSSVPAPIGLRVTGEHPIFAGLPTDQPIELMRDPAGGNQQWLSYSGYSGTTVAHVQDLGGGTDLGEAVGYRFTSSRSVEVLLASLGASGYGSPGDNWTPDAERIYLNAVRWAADATQGTLSGVVTSAGAPVQGATVTVLEAGRHTTTAADGSYRLGLMDGTYTVRVSAKGYADVEESVTISDSARVTRDFALTALPRSAVEGLVTDSDGAAVPGAVVSATGPDEWQETTAADGSFSHQGLLEGDYSLTVEATGFLPGTATVTVTAGAPAEVEIVLEPITVAVLGDVAGALEGFLREHDVAAGDLAWADAGDLASYDVVIVNGGDESVDRETFEAMVAEADAEEASVVYTGTWGVDRGGVRLLERFTDRVDVAEQGYGDGPVEIVGFDESHPLFDGLADPARLITEGGYYSALGRYDGAPLADLAVSRDDDDGPVGGLSAAYSWRSAGSIELVLSASAVTDAVGPGLGWTRDGGRLLLNAVHWAEGVEQQPPAAPTLAADDTLTTAPTIAVSGTAQWPSTVRVLQDGDVLATATTALDGTWSAEVPLVDGSNVLVAVADNFAGSSQPSAAVTVVRDTTGPVVEWVTPGDGSGSFDPEVRVSGQVSDEFAGVASLSLGDEDVKVDEDGTFDAVAPLTEGENVLTLTAVDSLGNETVESRTVLHRAWTPRWKVNGGGSAYPVKLYLDGGPVDQPPATDARLLVEAPDGAVVRRTLRWADDHYAALLRNLASDRYRLVAVLEIDGYTFTAEGPTLRVR